MAQTKTAADNLCERRIEWGPETIYWFPGDGINGIPNLFISDDSVCPTQGAANPALTIMALASRLAERIISGGATSPADK